MKTLHARSTAPERPLPGVSRQPLAARAPEALLVVALLLFAAAVRYPNLWLEPRMTDEWRMADRGLRILAEGRLPVTDFSHYIGALWNYLLALGYLLLGWDLLRVPRLVALFFGALTVVPTYLLGRELGGRWSGLLAGLLMATSPVHIVASSHVAWSHSTTPFFTTLGCWLLVGAARRLSGPRLGLAGLAFGVGFQTHPTILALLPGALAYLWLRARPLLRGVWLRRAGVLFLIGCLNLVAFALVYPSDFFSEVRGNQERNTRGDPEGAQLYLQNAAYFGLLLVRLPSGVALDTNDWRQVFGHPLVWLYTAALAGGAVVAARRHEPLALLLVASAWPLLSFAQFGSYDPVPDGRYAMPLLPPLYASLAFALASSRPDVRTGAPSRSLSGALALLAGLALALAPLATLSSYYASHAAERAVYRRTWDTLVEVQHRAPPGATVLMDEQFRQALGDNNTRRRVEFLLDALGFDSRYVPIDLANLAASLSDRRAIYLLSCPTYARAREQLGLAPLDDASPDSCEVVRAAHYP